MSLMAGFTSDARAMSGDIRAQVQGPALARYEVARILDTDGNIALLGCWGRRFSILESVSLLSKRHSRRSVLW